MDSLTIYPAVNTILSRLLSDVRATLGEQFVGMYLYGSLSSGDFDPKRSDIDFMVVTQSRLSEAHFSALHKMHDAITSSGLDWAQRLEGSYIPQSAVRTYDPTTNPHPMLGYGGPFYWDNHGTDWIIQRHIVRECGVVLTGPPPKTLIDPVSPDDLRYAVVGVLRGWWADVLNENPDFIKTNEYQAFTVLTMCRVLYTIETGKVGTKRESAVWALGNLPPVWHDLIQRSQTWNKEDRWDALAQTQALIRYALERSAHLFP